MQKYNSLQPRFTINELASLSKTKIRQNSKYFRQTQYTQKFQQNGEYFHVTSPFHPVNLTKNDRNYRKSQDIPAIKEEQDSKNRNQALNYLKKGKYNTVFSTKCQQSKLIRRFYELKNKKNLNIKPTLLKLKRKPPRKKCAPICGLFKIKCCGCTGKQKLDNFNQAFDKYLKEKGIWKMIKIEKSEEEKQEDIKNTITKKLLQKFITTLHKIEQEISKARVSRRIYMSNCNEQVNKTSLLGQDFSIKLKQNSQSNYNNHGKSDLKSQLENEQLSMSDSNQEAFRLKLVRSNLKKASKELLIQLEEYIQNLDVSKKSKSSLLIWSRKVSDVFKKQAMKKYQDDKLRSDSSIAMINGKRVFIDSQSGQTFYVDENDLEIEKKGLEKLGHKRSKSIQYTKLSRFHQDNDQYQRHSGNEQVTISTGKQKRFANLEASKIGHRRSSRFKLLQQTDMQNCFGHKVSKFFKQKRTSENEHPMLNKISRKKSSECRTSKLSEKKLSKRFSSASFLNSNLNEKKLKKISNMKNSRTADRKSKSSINELNKENLLCEIADTEQNNEQQIRPFQTLNQIQCSNKQLQTQKNSPSPRSNLNELDFPQEFEQLCFPHYKRCERRLPGGRRFGILNKQRPVISQQLIQLEQFKKQIHNNIKLQDCIENYMKNNGYHKLIMSKIDPQIIRTRKSNIIKRLIQKSQHKNTKNALQFYLQIFRNNRGIKQKVKLSREISQNIQLPIDQYENDKQEQQKSIANFMRQNQQHFLSASHFNSKFYNLNDDLYFYSLYYNEGKDDLQLLPLQYAEPNINRCKGKQFMLEEVHLKRDSVKFGGFKKPMHFSLGNGLESFQDFKEQRNLSINQNGLQQKDI